MTSFKPTDDCEERISMDFIRKVKDKLEERPECQDKVILTLDLMFKLFEDILYVHIKKVAKLQVIKVSILI